jgi:hypothetical protein
VWLANPACVTCMAAAAVCSLLCVRGMYTKHGILSCKPANSSLALDCWNQQHLTCMQHGKQDVSGVTQLIMQHCSSKLNTQLTETSSAATLFSATPVTGTLSCGALWATATSSQRAPRYPASWCPLQGIVAWPSSLASSSWRHNTGRTRLSW